MTRVAITGAAGFIGGALARQLAAAGVDVLTIDRTGPADVVADVLAAGQWAGRLVGCDAVVHAAALVGMPADDSGFWQVNVGGTREVLAAAKVAGVPRLVLLSSVTVFGNRFPPMVTESHPVRPTGVAYPDSKIAAEHLVLAAHAAGAVEGVVVRPGDVYGPGSQPWTVQPVRLIRARRAAIPGKRGVHSPIHIDDVVSGLAAATLAPAAGGRIITISGGAGVGTGEFFDYYARMLGRRSVPRIPRCVALALSGSGKAALRVTGGNAQLSPAAVRYLADRRSTYSIAAAERLLAWRPAVGLVEGMQRTEEWLTGQRLL
jgi:nucleoside-diphosphate-sugar epimerase